MTKPLEEQSAEELIDYIKTELRPELKQRREENERFQSVFASFQEGEVRGLLHIIGQFAENRERGAQLMRDLSNTVLGDPEPEPTEENEMTDSNQETETSTEEEMPAWAQALNEKLDVLFEGQQAAIQQTEAEAIAQYKQQAASFGFVEGTPEWVKLFQIAKTDLADGDLEKARDLYVKIEGSLPSADNATEEEDPTFPKTGGAGGSGAPSSDSSKEGDLDFSDKAAVQAAALRYMESSTSENAATP